MMVSQGFSETGAGALENLLGLVTDPEATKKRLAELAKQAKETQKLLDDIKKETAKNELALKEVCKKHDELDKKIAKFEQDQINADALMRQREQALKDQAASLESRTNDVESRTTAITKRERELKLEITAHENRVVYETTVARDAIAAERQTLQNEFAAKMTDLKKQQNSLEAKEVLLDDRLKSAENDKQFWQSKVDALKVLLKS